MSDQIRSQALDEAVGVQEGGEVILDLRVGW